MAFSRQQLSEATLAELRAMLHWWRRQTVGGIRAGRRSPSAPPMEIVIYGTLAETLNARGQADLDELSTDGATGRTFRIHDNIMPADTLLEAGSFVMAVWHWADSRYYLVQSRDCPLEA